MIDILFKRKYFMANVSFLSQMIIMRKRIEQIFSYYYIKGKLYLLSKSKIQTDYLWRRTNLRLYKKILDINQIKYYFGGYQLGSGAFGKVYPARRSTDGANVAIKVINLAESSSIVPLLIKSFLNEVNQSMKLSKESKHVVKMFDFDFNRSGLAFIVMERGGQDLEKVLINKTIVTICQQQNLWKQILNIFLTLYHNSLVHMDLKPSNLVFFGDRLKLVDLGNAQKENTRLKGSNGTYGFSAPEVHLVPPSAFSRCTYKADVWSIGAILYWINYGDGPTYNHYRGCYHPPSGVPSSKDSNILDILRHTIQMDCHRRPDPNWLTQHPFIRSL